MFVSVCREMNRPGILETKLSVKGADLILYIQTFLLSYDCDNFLRIYCRGERYPSALCG